MYCAASSEGIITSYSGMDDDYRDEGICEDEDADADGNVDENRDEGICEYEDEDSEKTQMQMVYSKKT